uniref:Uncharacterized protein n=1 Tax=Panagrolaimus sp. JU765 TaxID=591449 RepID=A0AC34PYK2_9BILA
MKLIINGIIFFVLLNYSFSFTPPPKVPYREIDLTKGFHKRIFLVKCDMYDQFNDALFLKLMEYGTNKIIKIWDLLDDPGMSIKIQSDSVLGGELTLEPNPQGAKEVKAYFQFKKFCKSGGTYNYGNIEFTIFNMYKEEYND